MIQSILRDLRIATFASKAISVLTVIKRIIITAMVVLFAIQIGKLLIKEKAVYSS